MTQILGEILRATVVFAGTNLDDIVLLTVLFLSSRAEGRPRPWQVWVGQYLGIAVLVSVSALAALGFTLVPDRWVGLLGLVPLALGLWGLVKAMRAGDHPEKAPVASGLGSVVALTIANGSDNISIYAPTFRVNGLRESVVTVVVFALLVAVWCLVASWLGSHRRVISLLERFGHWIVPIVFIAIGAFILVESGVLSQLV